jgi:hypothetical protein
MIWSIKDAVARDIGLGRVWFPCVRFTVLFAAVASGCVPSKQSVSSGYVGCSPSEITITNEATDPGFFESNETWIATCHGRNYACSKRSNHLHGEKSYGNVSHVACQPIGSEASSAQERPEPAAQRAPAENRPKAAASPTGAAGFTFGSDLPTARGACEGAGHTWSPAAAGVFECSGPAAELGFEARVTISFCSSRLCKVTVWHEPDDWSASLRALLTTLTSKYGEPAASDSHLPRECRPNAAFPGCVAEGRAHIRKSWSWRSGESVHLLVDRPPAGEAASIALRYERPANSIAANAGAL